MFYEFGLIEHILIILSIIVFSTRKKSFLFYNNCHFTLYSVIYYVAIKEKDF
jgi:hypothetical protein